MEQGNKILAKKKEKGIKPINLASVRPLYKLRTPEGDQLVPFTALTPEQLDDAVIHLSKVISSREQETEYLKTLLKYAEIESYYRNTTKELRPINSVKIEGEFDVNGD